MNNKDININWLIPSLGIALTAATNKTGLQDDSRLVARAGSWLRQRWTRRIVLCAGGCLTLAAMLWCRLGLASFDGNLDNAADDFLKEPAYLDSFSEPSVACALLKQEANRLLLVYSDKRSQQQAPDRPQIPEQQSLLALDARVWELHLDLSRKALRVYLDQHCWNQFVDRYLQIVQARPERWEAHAFFSDALDCADKCGRTKEVIDVLQHLIRAHPELGSLAGLRAELTDWKAAHPPNPEVAKR